MGMTKKQQPSPREHSKKVGRLLIVLLVCLGLVPFLGFCYAALGGIGIGLGERGRYYEDDVQPIPNPDIAGIRYLLQKEAIPQWLHDGAGIVFGSSGGKIYVVSTDGSYLRSFSRGSGEYDLDYNPDLSPDGSQIVYTTRRHKTGFLWNAANSYEIVVSNLDGSNDHRLTNNRDHDAYPAWSPDGNLIAFIRKHGELLIMDSRGSLINEDEVGTLVSQRPLWSPDGNFIAFRARYYNDTQYPYDNRDMFPNHYSYAIYTVRPDGSDRTMLGKSVGYPAWSPDSRRIAFVRRETVTTYQEDNSASGHLYIANPDGSAPRELISLQNEQLDDSISWSPDGSHVLLLSESPVVREDGVALAQTQQGLVHSWSPDGSKIAVHVQLNGPGVVLYTMNPDGTNGRALVERNDDGILLAANGRSLDQGQTAIPIYIDTVDRIGPSSTLPDIEHGRFPPSRE